jgi:hypothetical protein
MSDPLMNDSVSVTPTRFRSTRHGRTDHYVDLVRHATLAASSHNTQPWQFALEPGRITIVPDLSRRCPKVDPDDHHLYASLGCATENLVLAGRAIGLDACVSWDASTSSIRVDLEEAAAVRSALFDAIPRRQCSRAEYSGTALPNAQLRLLVTAAQGDGVTVVLITDREQKEQVVEYVAAGNTAQLGDPQFTKEMQTWIRFNAREAERSGDGLYGAVMGMPNVPRWFGNLALHVAVSPERQNRKDAAHIRSTAAIAVLCSEANDEQHWIEAGRSYERLALQAAVLDLRTAFINQPVEVQSLRPQFAAFLGIGHRRPDLIIRIGRGPEMPRSFRRPVGDVLVRP